MPFQPGISGNKHGRPKRGESFSELVRKVYKKDLRQLATEKMIHLASGEHNDDKVRIMAYLALHKAGWPHEQGPNVLVQFPTVPLFQLPEQAVIDVAPVAPLALPAKTEA